MGLVRRISALALAVTLSLAGIPLPAHAGEESPPLTLNGHPLSQLLNSAASGDPFGLAGLLEQETGQISGVLLDEDGQPLADQRMELDSEGPFRLVETTDANGAFSYTGLDPGRYEVQYRVDGDIVARSERLDLAAGARQEITLSLPKLGAPENSSWVRRHPVATGVLIGVGALLTITLICWSNSPHGGGCSAN